MSVERISYLLRKKLAKTATPADDTELAYLFAQTDDADLHNVIKPLWDEYKTTLQMPAEQSDAILARIIHSQTETLPAPRIPFIQRHRLRLAIAAIFLFAMAGAAYFILDDTKKLPQQVVQYKGDVAPGRDGAKLKLSDGKIILIDSVKDGLVAIDQTVKIFKKDGKIVYEGKSGELMYNEIITERGRQWSAVLPDGTVAWLNASSSLRYPLAFAANERLVVMTGEAAFKVVHNAAQPFRVKVGKVLIEDIGTEFNIKAYDDDNEIKTTLIEGSATVATSTKKQLVTAGQLSAVNNLTQDNILSPADIDEATAWRRGLFSFKDANIQTVMKDISRWYNVEVKYEGLVSDAPDFTGKMGRSLTLSQTFKALSTMRVHFRLEEDKRVVIMP